MRTTFLAVTVLVLLGCGIHRPPKVPVPTIEVAEAQAPSPDDRNVYCFIDGRTMSCAALQAHDPGTIERIEVIKGATAVDRYGPLAAGAIVVTSKPSADVERLAADRSERVFFFIDGRTASRSDFDNLPRETIQQIEVLRAQSAIQRYGSEAQAGAIIVRTSRGG